MKQQKTPWFSYTMPPRRKGQYQCQCGKFHIWDREWFFNTYYQELGRPMGFVSGHKWRGLTQKAEK